MDDILQRMLKVEQEADQLVQQRTQDARKILDDARKKCNLLRQQAQTALTAEAENLRQSVLQQTEQEIGERLKTADASAERRVEEFRKLIAPGRNAVIRVLAGLE